MATRPSHLCVLAEQSITVLVPSTAIISPALLKRLLTRLWSVTPAISILSATSTFVMLNTDVGLEDLGCSFSLSQMCSQRWKTSLYAWKTWLNSSISVLGKNHVWVCWPNCKPYNISELTESLRLSSCASVRLVK